MKRLVLFCLVLGLLGVNTGCGVVRAIVYSPFGAGCGPACGPALCGDCGPAPCGDCGPAPCGDCGPAPCGDCGPAPCGDACGSPCGGFGNPCGMPNCGRCRWPFPILSRLFHPISWGCGNGCGEVYWGDFHGDPPDCNDPCDGCGNWVGGGCGGGCVTGGYVSGRSTCGGCNDGGCSDCAGGWGGDQYVGRSTPSVQNRAVAYQPSQPYRTPVRR